MTPTNLSRYPNHSSRGIQSRLLCVSDDWLHIPGDLGSHSGVIRRAGYRGHPLETKRELGRSRSLIGYPEHGPTWRHEALK